MRCPVIVLLGCVPLLAACVGGETRDASAAAVPTATAGGVACISLARIRSTEVIDDRTILFRLNDGTTLANHLPNRCPSLGFERAFSYETSLSQLCSTDIITVINQGGGPAIGARCGLGRFVPYTPPERKEKR